ncbi:topology modulation protein [Aquibacillus saliphilus]|uniref:topology modulation protein n=1 Tax=Aquibacillus saliphilus TaxID=1909422 RepID=UPI001CF099E0|nr:topology modulation protein [Aquibacillus saliphilus]
MKRIMVIGVSAGVGKSTFARKLGKSLNIDVYHLDAYYWNPGWIEASFDEFKSAQENITLKEEWIIEGNYSSTFEIRKKQADTIIYLELPLYLCLFRVIKRWLTNRGRTRVDMGKDCEEKMDWKFLKFIMTTYYKRKNTMKNQLSDFQKGNSSNQVIILNNKKSIHSYLEDSL